MNTSTLPSPTQTPSLPGCSWKANWTETTQHYKDWWNHTGYLIGQWGGIPCAVPHEAVPPIPESSCYWTDPAAMAQKLHYELAHQAFPADIIPISPMQLGPGSLALFIGSEPEFSPHTIWYHPCTDSVEKLSPLKFDPENKWWKLTHEQLRRAKTLSQGRYLVGCPDLIEGIDILASLIGGENMFTDMLEYPELVHARLKEINQVWFESFDRIYELTRAEDGSSVFWAFMLWGPGKVAKIQCDASSMISTQMFGEFVVPYLREQCQRIDHTVYHLDGTQCIQHLDLLLSIKELDAIEWTPQVCSGVPSGGSPKWHDMYRKIKAAGKSVQLVNTPPEEIIPLFDAVGPEGMFILTQFNSVTEAEKLFAEVEKRFPR